MIQAVVVGPLKNISYDGNQITIVKSFTDLDRLYKSKVKSFDILVLVNSELSSNGLVKLSTWSENRVTHFYFSLDEACIVNVSEIINHFPGVRFFNKSLLIEKNLEEYSYRNAEKAIELLKRLSESSSMEEYVLNMDSHNKDWRGLFHPILIVPGMSSDDVYYVDPANLIQKKKVIRGEAKRESLANLLSRPVVQFEMLEFKNGKLLFEHSLPTERVERFRSYIQSYSPSFEVAYERIFQNLQNRRLAKIWEETFESIEDQVSIISPDFEVIRSNKKNMRERSPCYKNFFDQNKSCIGCPLQKSLEKNEPVSSQIHAGDRIFEVNSYPIVDSDGNTEGSQGVVMYYLDVTDSRKLYSQLIQSEKMAALGQMAGHVAHELNNPLTGLAGMAELYISDQEVEGELRGDFLEIHKAVKRSQGIIRNFLQFSSIEQDGVTEEVNVDELIRKTLPLLKSALTNHRIMTNLETGKFRVRAEPQMLQQVMFNLINNSCQALDTGGEISLNTHRSEDSIIFQVIDNGPGVPEELRGQLFEPFFSTKREGEGTGLGLYICQQIVRKFGGDITFENGIDSGACFTVKLPICEDL